jgi:hypothetical protein
LVTPHDDQGRSIIRSDIVEAATVVVNGRMLEEVHP